jgi:hypothetical protein
MYFIVLALGVFISAFAGCSLGKMAYRKYCANTISE